MQEEERGGKCPTLFSIRGRDAIPVAVAKDAILESFIDLSNRRTII